MICIYCCGISCHNTPRSKDICEGKQKINKFLVKRDCDAMIELWGSCEGPFRIGHLN